MTRHELKKIIFENRAEIKELMLTHRQVDIINFTRKRGVTTSSEISEFYGISIQNASVQLKKLFEKGYLRCAETTAKSGGIINVYRSVL